MLLCRLALQGAPASAEREPAPWPLSATKARMDLIYAVAAFVLERHQRTFTEQQKQWSEREAALIGAIGKTAQPPVVPEGVYASHEVAIPTSDRRRPMPMTG